MCIVASFMLQIQNEAALQNRVSWSHIQNEAAPQNRVSWSHIQNDWSNSANGNKVYIKLQCQLIEASYGASTSGLLNGLTLAFTSITSSTLLSVFNWVWALLKVSTTGIEAKDKYHLKQRIEAAEKKLRSVRNITDCTVETDSSAGTSASALEAEGGSRSRPKYLFDNPA
eukprot:gene20899-22950_t